MNLLKRISIRCLLLLIFVCQAFAVDVLKLNNPDSESSSGASLSGVKESYLGWDGQVGVLKAWQLSLTITPDSMATVTPKLDFFWSSHHLYYSEEYRYKGVVVSLTSDFKLSVQHGETIIQSTNNWLEYGKSADMTLKFELFEDIEENPFQGIFSISSADQSLSLLISDTESLEYLYLNNYSIGGSKLYPYLTTGSYAYKYQDIVLKSLEIQNIPEPSTALLGIVAFASYSETSEKMLIVALK